MAAGIQQLKTALETALGGKIVSLTEALGELVTGHRWWLLTFPCTLLALTLLSLNFLGDGLRDVLDPKREAAKI